MADVSTLTGQERKSGVGDSTLSGNDDASGDSAKEEGGVTGLYSLRAATASLCGKAGRKVNESLSRAKNVLCKSGVNGDEDTMSSASSVEIRKTSKTDKVSEGREPSVSFDSYESFASLDPKPSTAESLRSSLVSCFATLNSACGRLRGKKELDPEMKKQARVESAKATKGLRAEVASWEYSKFYTLVRLSNSVQPGSHHKLDTMANQSRWRKSYLVAIMLLIIIIFFTPVITAIAPNWANAEKMCVRRKPKIDQINALLTQKTRLQEASEQMELTRLIQGKTDEMLQKGHVMSKPAEEADLFKHAVNPHFFFGEGDNRTLSEYVSAARGGTLSSRDIVLFKMYQAFPHTCSVETIASMAASSYTRNCDISVSWNTMEHKMMNGIRSCHDLSENCKRMLKDSVGGNILGNGKLCDGFSGAIESASKSVDEYEDAMNCDPVRYDVFRDLFQQFFATKGDEVLDEISTFCNPRDSLIATQAQQAYESFIKYSQRAADNFQVPEVMEEPEGFFDEARRQIDIIVLVWACFKVVKVIAALPASPYSQPWFSVYRYPIVHLSPITVAVVSLIFMNLAAILSSEGIFAGLLAALNYFNDDPCNTMASFTRERVHLINQTCNELLAMSREHIEARYTYGITFQSMNLYRGCFNNFWSGLGIHGDCPLCNYVHEDFVLCDDCTGNASWHNNYTRPHQLREMDMNFGQADLFMQQGFEGFCGPDVLGSLYLDPSNEEVYLHSGAELLFYSGFILELIFPILLLHCVYELFAVKNPTSVHISTVEATSRRYIIHPKDNPMVNTIIRWKHEPCLCLTSISLILLLVSYAAFSLIEIEKEGMYAVAYSYLPDPVVNVTAMTKPDFLETRMKRVPSKEKSMENRWMCWGDYPESLPLVSHLSNLSASKSAICGVNDAGGIVCMGKMTTAYHYAINGDDKYLPPQVNADGVPPEELYERVALGETFGCALNRRSRDLVCWGKNIPGKFKLATTDQDRCGSEWFYVAEQLDKNTRPLNNNVGSFESSFHSAKYDEIAAGSYHLCGYTASTTTLKCVGYFKGGTRTCSWTTRHNWRRECERTPIFKRAKRCWDVWDYTDHHRHVRLHRYFRLERTDVLKFATTYDRICMLDANFMMDCFDLDRTSNNLVVGGSTKSARRYDFSNDFDKKDPSSLKLLASNNLLCLFQRHRSACETSPGSMSFTVENTTQPVISFIFALNRDVRPLSSAGVHSTILPSSQRKSMFLQADGVLDDSPPRVPPIKEAVSTGDFNCVSFKSPG